MMCWMVEGGNSERGASFRVLGELGLGELMVCGVSNFGAVVGGGCVDLAMVEMTASCADDD